MQSDLGVYRAMGYLHSQAFRLFDRWAARLRSEGGQGTVEYVGLILVVALIMAAVVMAADKFKTDDSIAKAVLEKIQDAIKKVKY